MEGVEGSSASRAPVEGTPHSGALWGWGYRRRCASRFAIAIERVSATLYVLPCFAVDRPALDALYSE